MGIHKLHLRHYWTTVKRLNLNYRIRHSTNFCRSVWIPLKNKDENLKYYSIYVGLSKNLLLTQHPIGQHSSKEDFPIKPIRFCLRWRTWLCDCRMATTPRAWWHVKAFSRLVKSNSKRKDVSKDLNIHAKKKFFVGNKSCSQSFFPSSSLKKALQSLGNEPFLFQCS